MNINFVDHLLTVGNETAINILFNEKQEDTIQMT